MPAPSREQVAEFLAFAEKLADAARGAILPHFRSENLQTQNKKAGVFDPVTAADRQAEAAMRALIAEAFPEHGVIGEEEGERESRSGFTWYLDPIDGTRAFLAGLPVWGTLIGLAYEGRPLIGIVDQGFSGERFRGWPGGADFIQGQTRRPLKVRACSALTDAIISTTDPNLFTGAQAGGFEQLRQTAKITRFGCDCYAYAMVAMGGIDLVAESRLAPWDIAAIIPVIEGAGGLITNWRGEPVWRGEWFSSARGRTHVLAAGDARVHAEALMPLKRAAG
ncbi:MAG TPA: histidinol-phosphatase [Caulobacterales bacterium]|nr:histidinol-phosphatase [Caulobacterales bacterium]